LKLAAKNYAGARAAADEAFRKNPADASGLRIVLQSYANEKHMAEGIQKIREYAIAMPQSAAAQQYVGGLLLSIGKLDEARQAFTAAKAANPSSVEADLALAQLDSNAGKMADARKRAQTALAAHPGSVPARLFLAQMDVLSRNYPAAAEQYANLLPSDPKNVAILNNLAYSLAESGKYDEAIKYAQEAKELAPERAEIDDTLGWIMYRKGVYSSAIRYLTAAASRNATALYHYHLAMAYSKAGDSEKANDTLLIALTKDPTLPEAADAQRLLSGSQSASK
jgi:tetratricopeptide (TPR) repeat protein